ncbi:MAG: hypothetical protein IPO27_12525 [Bacteroidetes bacterium]|nr:hypothetical protein [Bacteroidota bacterium]
MFIATHEANAQPCNLPIMNMHTVYIFTTKTNHTMEEVMGAKLNPMLFNFVFVKTAAELNELKKLARENKLQSSVFVFFSNGKAIRYCNVEEFAKAVENKIELKVEE